MTLRAGGPLAVARSAANRRLVNPLANVSLTIPQRTFVSSSAKQAAWVDGNTIGKSWGLAFDALHRCRGTHPYISVRRPPVRILVIGYSFEQMEPLQEKLWQLVPKDELAPSCGYEEGRGIIGKPPRLVFTKGPGRGSRIVFATYKQGPGRVAGSTLHHVIMDEPPPEGVYDEVVPRLLNRGGTLRIGMTPVPDMPDVRWLRAKCESGDVEFHNYGLTPENVWPDGYPAPWLTQADIDEFVRSLPERTREMRTRGAWEQLVSGAWLTAFSRERHVRSLDLADFRGWQLVVGLDHGTAEGKQCAMLVAIQGGKTDRPRVAFLEESVAEGFTTPEHDAQAIVAMLKRRGLTVDHVDAWIGDVPTGSEKYQVRKSNTQVRRELARQLGRKLHNFPEFRQPVKYQSSLSDGIHLLNTLFSRDDDVHEPMALVDDECVNFIAFCERFDGNPRHTLKDVGDAGRYAVEAGCTAQVAPILTARY